MFLNLYPLEYNVYMNGEQNRHKNLHRSYDIQKDHLNFESKIYSYLNNNQPISPDWP